MVRLRAGLVGLGMMGRNHARVLRSVDGSRPRRGGRPGRRRPWHGGRCPRGLHRRGDDRPRHRPRGGGGTDGVPPRRGPSSSRRRACHTLVEKPLATNADEARQLVDAFESAGLVGAVGHIERCNPALRALRTRLDAGELGEIYQVATRRQGPFPNRIADVGVVKDLATHDIDLTAWVIRSPYAAGLGAHGAQERSPARGPHLGHRPDGRRHRRQPPGELALPAQGAGHRGHW